MNAPSLTRCLLSLEADDDPTVASRILQLLTVRGENPDWFSIRRHRPHALRIAVELNGVDEEHVRQLALLLQRIPAVIDVSRSWIGQREQLVA